MNYVIPCGVRYVAVFLAVALADGLWSLYTLAVAEHAPLNAALYSAGIVFAGAFVTLAYITDRRYLVPAVLGAFAGTYLTVALGG